MYFNAQSFQDTNRLAQKLAPFLQAGDCLLLSGPVGAGKTAFARALIQTRLHELGRLEDVPSPSFALIQTYDLGDCYLNHIDLYRLSSSAELFELGIEEAFESAITVIEWPERLMDIYPPSHLAINFSIASDTQRDLTATANGARAETVLAYLSK